MVVLLPIVCLYTATKEPGVTEIPSVVVGGAEGPNLGAAIGGVVFGIVVILAIVSVVIIVTVLW